MMNHSTPEFVCFELINDNIKIQPLTDLLKERASGFHAFYTHDVLVSGIQNSVDSSSLALKQIFETALENQTIEVSSLIDDTSISELLSHKNTVSPLILINGLGTTTKADTIQTFFQTLRENLSGDSSFEQAVGYSLNQAASWDIFLEREKYSGIIPGTHGYHEYILWEAHGLLDNTKWGATNNTGKNNYAWTGSSWLAEKFSPYSSDTLLPCPSVGLDSWVSSSNERLIRSLASLTDFYKGAEQQLYNFEHNNNFARSLCEFLPKHRSLRDSNKFILSNMNGEKGGPIRWRGVFDDALHLRKRFLLMDGWLSLWPYQETSGETVLYLQPGSLALLYWAAQRVSMPYTDTPEDFLDHYDWRDPHWFGGNWTYPPTKELDNGKS